MTGDDDNEGEPIGSDEEMDDDEDDEDEDAESDDDEDSGLDEEDAEAEVDPELRKRIAEVLQVNGAAEGDADDDSESEEESLMGDDEMMAMDEKLVEIFRLRTEEKKGRKGASDLGPPSSPPATDSRLPPTQTPSGRRRTSRIGFLSSSRPSSRSSRRARSSFASSCRCSSSSFTAARPRLT